MSRAGRRRLLQAKRDARGKVKYSKAVLENKIMSVALAQPHRRSAKTAKGEDAGRSQMLGYSLGRLRFLGVIDDAQLAAGERYTGLAVRLNRIWGIPCRWPSPSIERRIAGEIDLREMEPEEVVAIKSAWANAMAALLAYGPPFHVTIRILTRVCLYGQDPGPDELEFLGLALKTLGAHWSGEIKR